MLTSSPCMLIRTVSRHSNRHGKLLHLFRKIYVSIKVWAMVHSYRWEGGFHIGKGLTQKETYNEENVEENSYVFESSCNAQSFVSLVSFLSAAVLLQHSFEVK